VETEGFSEEYFFINSILGHGQGIQSNCCRDIYNNKKSLEQWFPTGVPWCTRVPQRGVRGAAKFGITALYYIRCHFNQLEVLPNILKT
jgi:hypothetical protein